MPIPFLKAIDISPLALVSDSVAGNGPAGSSTTDALEAVRELFSGDGQAEKGRKGQNEVCCRLLRSSVAKRLYFLCPDVCLMLDLIALGPSSSWCARQINDKPYIDEPGPGSRLP